MNCMRFNLQMNYMNCSLACISAGVYLGLTNISDLVTTILQ